MAFHCFCEFCVHFLRVTLKRLVTISLNIMTSLVCTLNRAVLGWCMWILMKTWSASLDIVEKKVTNGPTKFGDLSHYITCTSGVMKRKKREKNLAIVPTIWSKYWMHQGRHMKRRDRFRPHTVTYICNFYLKSNSLLSHFIMPPGVIFECVIKGSYSNSWSEGNHFPSLLPRNQVFHVVRFSRFTRFRILLNLVICKHSDFLLHFSLARISE